MHRLPRRAALAAATGLIFAAPLVAGPPAALAQAERNTLSFEVTTSGDCADVTFTGASGVPGSEFVEVELADDDGDGVFTGEQSLNAEDAQQVVQLRADGEVIEDAGTIDVTGGATVEATFDCAATGGGTGDGGTDDGGAGMPDTGGEESATWAVTGAALGGLLAAAGALLLVRRRLTGR